MSETRPVADAVFADRRLAELYDALDPDRSDLDAYLALAEELRATTVVDIGCGTGTFACLLTHRGIDVTAVDPAEASVDVARRKPGADRVRWIVGDATVLPPLQVDLVTMTANVAQVFVTDDAWHTALHAAHRALRPGGHLVFETRDPAKEAWRAWTPDQSRKTTAIDGVGAVETWVELLHVEPPLVSFRWTFVFLDDGGTTLTSESTLRFRTRAEITADLAATGFGVVDVRDAPDRPGLEHVFVAQRAAG